MPLLERAGHLPFCRAARMATPTTRCAGGAEFRRWLIRAGTHDRAGVRCNTSRPRGLPVRSVFGRPAMPVGGCPRRVWSADLLLLRSCLTTPEQLPSTRTEARGLPLAHLARTSCATTLLPVRRSNPLQTSSHDVGLIPVRGAAADRRRALLARHENTAESTPCVGCFPRATDSYMGIPPATTWAARSTQRAGAQPSPDATPSWTSWPRGASVSHGPSSIAALWGACCPVSSAHRHVCGWRWSNRRGSARFLRCCAKVPAVP